MTETEPLAPAGVEHITLIELLDTDTPSNPPGRGTVLFGRYQVLGLLGVGGMGAVYRVWDAILEEEVALKMLRRDLLAAPGMLARFRQEVKLARRVTHPNVVRTYDLGEQDGEYCLTMEYIRGRSLRRLLVEDGALDIERALEVARQATAGIAAAHDAGVLHCDLKPDNLLIDDRGRVAITDFGIARAMGGAGGPLAGTPAYMAPEVATAALPADHRSDLYSLGVVLFELFTGKAAFQDIEQRKKPELRIGRPAPDPRAVARVPDALAEVIRSLLAPRPEGRPPSASAVLAAIDDVEAATSRRNTPPPRGAVPSPGTPSLAVLPFHNAGESEDAHLAEGLTEEIIDSLSATRGLRVRPLSSTASAGPASDALVMGRALAVTAVVEGTVRRRDDAVTLAVRLIGVEDGFQLWARRFRCPSGDALLLADEVARSIATALAAELGQQTRAGPTDPVALDLYLQARFALRTRWDVGASEAVSLLEQALARAPEDPNALAVYAQALARQAFFEQRRGPELERALARATRSAELSVRIAPEQGDAWLALANAHLYSGALPEAASALREAVRRAPGLSRAQQMFGSLSLDAGRAEEGLEHLHAALSIDPEAMQARMDLARGYALLGGWEQADATLAAALTAPRGVELRALTEARLSLWAPGRTFTMPRELSSASASARTVGQLLQWYRHIHEHGTAPPGFGLDQAQPGSGELGLLRSVRGQYTAELLAWLGQADPALEALEEAASAGLYDLLWLERCPLLEPLRGHPRWSAIHERVDGRARSIRAALEGR